MISRNLIQFCLFNIFILCFTEIVVLYAKEKKQDEQRNPCFDYEPIGPIPSTSYQIPESILRNLVCLGVGAASIVAITASAALILKLVGFGGAGITVNSLAALLQSIFYGGAIPTGSWFAFFQSWGMTGIVIPKYIMSTLYTLMAFCLFQSVFNFDKCFEMNNECNDCVINRLDCLPAKIRLFEHLDHEESQRKRLSSIENEYLTAVENWESFVRLSCGCCSVFSNNQKKGQELHEIELIMLFKHYVPYFFRITPEQLVNISSLVSTKLN